MDDVEHIRGKQIAYEMEKNEIGVYMRSRPCSGSKQTALAAISLSETSFGMTEQNLITVSEKLKKAAKESGKKLSLLYNYPYNYN